MLWEMSHRFDRRSVALADRHYSRHKVGTPQFVPPGRNVVLYARTATGEAVWASVWQAYVKHAWGGAWQCTIFRNEGAGLSSALILEALAATRARWGDPPEKGMITFVDPDEVRSSNPGYCFKMAGFRLIGYAKDGKPCLGKAAAEMPAAEPARGLQYGLAV